MLTYAIDGRSSSQYKLQLGRVDYTTLMDSMTILKCWGDHAFVILEQFASTATLVVVLLYFRFPVNISKALCVINKIINSLCEFPITVYGLHTNLN